jgi:hypothetical protein
MKPYIYFRDGGCISVIFKNLVNSLQVVIVMEATIPSLQYRYMSTGKEANHLKKHLEAVFRLKRHKRVLSLTSEALFLVAYISSQGDLVLLNCNFILYL